MTQEELLNYIKEDYDWKEAFYFTKLEPALPNNECEKLAIGNYSQNDVEYVYMLYNGCNDEENWIGIFRLKDSRLVALSAGCDYTGWDCQAGGKSVAATSLNELWYYGLDAKERDFALNASYYFDEILKREI